MNAAVKIGFPISSLRVYFEAKGDYFLVFSVKVSYIYFYRNGITLPADSRNIRNRVACRKIMMETDTEED